MFFSYTILSIYSYFVFIIIIFIIATEISRGGEAEKWIALDVKGSGEIGNW
jgi:hypothetical protein